MAKQHKSGGEGEQIVMVSDFHRQSSHSFQSVSTVLSEITVGAFQI